MSAIAERYHKLKTCPVFYGGCINTICARGGGPLRGQVFPCPARARARARPPRSIMRPAPTPGRARPRPPNQFTAPLEKCRGEYKRAPCLSSICPARNRALIPHCPLASICLDLPPAILDCLSAFAPYHYSARIYDASGRNVAPAMAYCAFHPMPPATPEILLASTMPSATIHGIFILAYLFTIA